MKWNKWEPGRQGGDYRKKLIFAFKIPFMFAMDSYIVEFGPRYYLNKHKDKVEGKRHFRLNIVLKGKGRFICEKTIFERKRIVFFRPDIREHSMINGHEKRRILSIGFVV